MKENSISRNIDVVKSEKTAKIFLSTSPLLLRLIIKNKFGNSVNLKKFYGIYLITNNESIPIENNLKEIKDISYISYHIISLAYRFKRLKINRIFAKYYTLPFREDLDTSLRYIISTTELIVKRYGLKDQKIELYINKFNDKYINLYLKRYLKKKYRIHINFISLGKVIKPGRQIHYSYKCFNPRSLLSIFNLISFKTYTIPDQLLKSQILEVSSFKKIKEPYHINKKQTFLQNKVYSLDFNDLNKFGLNKFKSILFLFKKFFNNIQKLKLNDIHKIAKYNLFIDYIQININRLYMYNISVLLNKVNIKYLFCTHRSMTYESLIYKVCKSAGVKSIASDFSLGYPLKNIYKKEISLTTRPDILMVNSLFRKEQYSIANRDYINSGNKLEIINCNCIQVEYSKRNSSDPKNIKKFLDKINLSIFDNNYGENLAIRSKYTEDLAKTFHPFRDNIYCFVHSKRNIYYLENELSKNKINFCKGIKGDFSLANNSDLVISIGFQGAAIKAASAFNKPVIFFSSDKNYFDKVSFSRDQIFNQKLIYCFKELIFDKQEISQLLSSKNKIKKDFSKILLKTNNFLELIGYTNNTISISSYLQSLEN